MPSPDNFFDRLQDFSGFWAGEGRDSIENDQFYISGLRIQNDAIYLELIHEDMGECEVGITINDLVDGIEPTIRYCSVPGLGAELKAETLTALRKAIARIEAMTPAMPPPVSWYSVNAAAEKLALAFPGESIREWAQIIIRAILDGELPGVLDGLRVDPARPGATVAAVVCEVLADDLNAWLESLGNDYRFE